MNKRFRNKKVLIFLLLIVLGFYYRWILSSFAYHEIVLDMSAYSELAKEILSGKLAAHCCNHGIGYPLFLALVYRFFGVEQWGGLRVAQGILDVLSAVLVYHITKAVFHARAAMLALAIYLLNPFTSAYTGYFLTESLSIFLITLLAAIITQKRFLTRKIWWFLFGFALGWLLATKYAFYLFTFFLIGLVCIVFIPNRKRVWFLAFVAGGFLLASAYSFVGYYRHYGVVSLRPPYNIYRSFGGGWYAGFFQGRYPELFSGAKGFQPKFSSIMINYKFYYDTDPTGIVYLNKQYRDLFFLKLKTDWPLFLKNTFQNMIWLWDKYFLYLYVDPLYPRYASFIRAINILLFCLFGTGIVRFVRTNKWAVFDNLFFVFTLALFFFITISFSMVSNETRHTLPFYPLLIMWAGFGAWKILEDIFHRINSKT